jgi:hypothetical protein
VTPRWVQAVTIACCLLAIAASASGATPQRWELITVHACLIFWVLVDVAGGRR